MKFTRLKIILIAKIFLLNLGGALYADTQFKCDQNGEFCICEVDPDSAISFTIDTKIIGEQSFEFSAPAEYFQVFYLKPRPGSIRRATSLTIHGEHFGPWPSHLRKASSEGPIVNMLLTTYVPLQKVGESALSVYSRPEGRDAATLEERPSDYGLTELLYATNGKRFKARKLVYLARNETNEITNVISCFVPGPANFSQCAHTIETRLIDVRMSYGIEMLPEWRSLERKARSLIDCFTPENN